MRNEKYRVVQVRNFNSSLSLSSSKGIGTNSSKSSSKVSLSKLIQVQVQVFTWINSSKSLSNDQQADVQLEDMVRRTGQ